MDFFACLIDSWLWLCIFPSHPKNKTKSSHCSNQHSDYLFILSVDRFSDKRKQENLRIDFEKMYAIHLKLGSN